MKSTELQKLAQRIREARISVHLSQAKLAKEIGVSDKSVSAYEQGRSTPPFDKLKRIAMETRKPLSYFTEESNEDMTIIGKLQAIEQELEDIKKLLKRSQNNS